MSRVAILDSDAEIAACYTVMTQLRPHLTVPDFVPRIRRQMEEGYRLAALYAGESVKAVAGFRIMENLWAGRQLYVDDLVADEGSRSQGYGGSLFDWLVSHARENGCDQLHLDSGVQRFSAHRFYLDKRMQIVCHHFALELS